ncbi:MAG: CxxC-x17-CxxC domain-containing protein [Candidatus Falkowbacteria bacterium]
MGSFNKFGGGGRGGKSFGGGGRDFGGRSGGKSFGGGRDFGGNREDRPMFPAVCEKCGQSCEVPFRPTGDRPVFCSSCFKAQGSGSDYAPKSFGGGSSYAPKSFGSDRGGFKREATPSAGVGISKGQVDLIISKLDKILSILSPVKVAPAKVELKKVSAIGGRALGAEPTVKVEKKAEKKSVEKPVEKTEKIAVKKEKKEKKAKKK